MPRTKKSARRGNSRSASHSNGRGGHLETSFVPFAGTSSPKRRHNGFTLQEEARNTEREHSFWDSDQKLRHTKVNFVSAGRLENSEAKDPEATAALAHMSLDSPGRNEVNMEEEEYEELEDPKPGRSAVNMDSTDQEPPQSLHHFVIDTFGTEAVDTGLPPPLLRSVSPAPSNSSEEVILFRGRDRIGKGPVKRPKIFGPSADPIDARIRLVENKIHEQEHLLDEVLHHKDESPSPSKVLASSREVPDHKQSNYQCRQGRRGKRRAEQADEDALLADYIANIDEDMLVSNNYNQRELGGTYEDVWQDEEETSSGDPLQSREHAFQSGWTPSDVGEFDDLSTSDGVMGEVQAILSKREREIGSQYLVVWEGQTVDEARWVPASTLTSVGAMSHIELFEAEAKLVAELEGNEEDSSDSDDMDIDDAADEDDEDDEDDLFQREIDRMTDEKIARLLAKQEELGMGSNELFLFDDTADADEDEEAALPKSKFTSIMTSPKSRPKGREARRPRGDFPAANALADAYDGFDVMDFDRPSLKKKPKGRRGLLAFDLSDSELEDSMQMAWDNDRIKKNERKQEREKLRAQGLLGNKSGKPDLKEKYKEGMGIHAVKDEIKNFLLGSNTTLALPPMDKADRKVIHELANAFNLKSKSAGGGNKRFPVLYRTSRTSVYTEGTFNAVEARLTRRYLPRMDVNGKRSGGESKRTGRGGGGINNAAVSYRDGDIVGGSAPELGVENRGRAMLEKMGWSRGTALGALNNKGILQPVSHIVKTTKAGLG